MFVLRQTAVTNQVGHGQSGLKEQSQKVRPANAGGNRNWAEEMGKQRSRNGGGMGDDEQLGL